jgi:GxxExxY protein
LIGLRQKRSISATAEQLLFGFGMFSDETGFEQLTEAIIECTIDVHAACGPGLLESVYQKCVAIELRAQAFVIETERQISLTYRDVTFAHAFRLDIVVEDLIVLEIKSVKSFEPVHEAQLITYLKLTGYPIGLLMNFNVPLLKNGIRRVVHPDLYSRRRQGSATRQTR